MTENLDCRISSDLRLHHPQKADAMQQQILAKSWGMKAIPQLILKLQDPKFRESALHLLSSFLFQEVLLIYRMMADGSLNERACMRLINVIILFQFVSSACIVNFLVPLLLFASTLEVYDNVRAVASSVFGILCQARESSAVQWAIENVVVEGCLISVDTGNELTKVIGLHIVESILWVDFGISYIFSPAADHLLNRLMRTWDTLVNQIAVVHDFPPRILFPTSGATLLCHDERGHNLVKQSLPESFINGTFHESLKEFPVIHRLLSQLPLIAGINDSRAAPSVHEISSFRNETGLMVSSVSRSCCISAFGCYIA
ncbi:uncharacterized protein LOC115677276 [Syzygium oleosum]|uniref:uncharacterized protein LOC115677276 n=1 Tax=Syzygium oleosum TaxID=219896 RepID=UPI0024BA4627|nr:uncharacterized protein LOC115677276 [Syzygium oleosum]